MISRLRTNRPTNSGWVKPSQGAKYAGVSVKVFRRWLKNGLRHIRLDSGRLLTRYGWIDEYLERLEVVNKTRQMAEELVKSLI